jgi:biopolymer transport protein ExbB/TolQ
LSPTSIEVFLITTLVLGIVVAIFGLIYVWEKWAKATRLAQRIDRFLDRLSEKFDR